MEICIILLLLDYFVNYDAKCEEDENSMVGCKYSLCSHGLFSHLDCVVLRQAPGELEDWLCSIECEAAGSSGFYFCGKYWPVDVLV